MKIAFAFAVGALVGALTLHLCSESLSGQRTPPKSAAMIPASWQGRLALFLLAGQSNMAGRGKLPGPDPDPRVFSFGPDYHWHMAQDPLGSPPAVDEAAKDRRSGGVGPGLSFAKELLRLRPKMVAIGLIPCARGDSSIWEWRYSHDDHTLYGATLKRSWAASAMGEVEGLLWYQGESDALDPVQHAAKHPNPAGWGPAFGDLVGYWRQELTSHGHGQGEQARLPIVFARIGRTTKPEAYPGWEAVRREQAAAEVLGVARVETDDLPLADHVHLSTEGQERLGKRFARAMHKLLH